MDYTGYRKYKGTRQEGRGAAMESGRMYVHSLDENGEYQSTDIAIRYSGGTVGGNIRVHASWSEDGSICAQLELRFENQSMLVNAPEVRMDDAGYETGRSWVLVEMEPRQSFTEPLRFRVNIPGLPRSPSVNIGDVKTATTEIESARKAVSAVRSRCGHSHGCRYPVCELAAHWEVRELADDRCVASMVALEAQSLHAPNPGT